MIAKLDKLILRTFIGPFIATFFIALFVVVVQFFWKYVDELVGKGIDIFFLLKLIGIVALQTGVLFALPIAILLASLMTFGNLAESFELLAIKSAGISLLRFMRSIFIFVLGICGLAYLFNNYVIPKVNLKFFTVLTDIRHSKPSFDLKEGSFYTGIQGIAIQVEKKDDKTGSLQNVVIFENSNSNYQDNFIVAEKGKMSISADKKGLDFVLYNGERVQEKGSSGSQSTELMRVRFKELKKTFDISHLIMKQTNDTVNKSFYRMLNLTQLNSNIDSLNKVPGQFYVKTKANLSGHFDFYNSLKDSSWKSDNSIKIGKKVKAFKDILPDSVKNLIGGAAGDKIGSVKNQLEMDLFEYNSKKDALRYHNIEWHKKFALSLVSLVMFLIGAPLGSIIRRGGLGTPLIWGIAFFAIYFVLFSSGEKNANANSYTPFVGMWLPLLVLTPIGIWFTVKARKDQSVINKEKFFAFFGFVKTGVMWMVNKFKKRKIKLDTTVSTFKNE